MEASPLPGPFGLHPIRPWQAPPKRIGWRMAIHESRALLPTITVRAFIRRRTNMPSADFCRGDQSTLRYLQSRFFATHNRSPRGKLYNLPHAAAEFTTRDRKSTRLNSSHDQI